MIKKEFKRSKYTGVVWGQFRNTNGNMRKGRWKARIMVNGKLINPGRFEDEIDAARAYDDAVIEHGLEHTQKLNFPPDVLNYKNLS